MKRSGSDIPPPAKELTPPISQRHDSSYRNEVHARGPENMETLLIVLWKEVLSCDHITPEDNFFALGGDSLLALRAVWGIQQRFGVDMAPIMLFRMPTIRDLAHYIEELALAQRLGKAKSADGDSTHCFEEGTL